MNLRESIASQPMRGFQSRIIALCIALAFVDGFEVLVSSFTAANVAKEFGIDSVQRGTFLSAGTFGMGIGAIVISPLADKLGRRKHILMCLALIVVGMIASAIAPNFTFLLVARFFAGLWIGALIPSINILVSEYASDARRGTVMGIYGVGLPAGAATGGFITRFLMGDAGNWRNAFWFGAILTAVLLVLAAVWLTESIQFLVEKRPAGALEAYNKIGAKLGYPAESSLPPAHVSASGKPANVVQMIFGGKMLVRTALLWLGYACLMAAFYFANAWTPSLVTSYLTAKQAKGSAGTEGWVDVPKTVIEGLAKANPAKWDVNMAYVQRVSDASASATGTNMGVLVAVGGVIGALLFAVLARKIHPRILTAFTLLWGLAAYVIYANVFQSTGAALVAAIGVGIAANGGVAAFYAISPSIYPTQARGTGVGWMVGFGRVVSILAPIVTGAMIDGGTSAQTLYQAFGVICALGAVLVFLLHRTFRSDATTTVEELPAAVH